MRVFQHVARYCLLQGELKAGAEWRTCVNALGPPETRHIHTEQHKIEEDAVEAPQRRFTGFIPNDVMALSSRPYRSTESPTVILVYKND